MQETRVQSLGQEDPLEEEMATHSVFLSGKSHGQRKKKAEEEMVELGASLVLPGGFIF